MPRPDNRQALLDGARRCLDAQGYARTSARDVATAAGVSTAAIGYHFGTIDTLLVDALFEGMHEWSHQLDERLTGITDLPQSARLDEFYAQALASFEGHRGVLAASFELMARADADDDVRARLRAMLTGARDGLPVLVGDSTAAPGIDPLAGTISYAILSGLIVQWLVDPEAMPAASRPVD